MSKNYDISVPIILYSECTRVQKLLLGGKIHSPLDGCSHGYLPMSPMLGTMQTVVHFFPYVYYDSVYPRHLISFYKPC